MFYSILEFFFSSFHVKVLVIALKIILPPPVLSLLSIYPQVAYKISLSFISINGSNTKWLFDLAVPLAINQTNEI